jgi:hypothetical protein
MKFILKLAYENFSYGIWMEICREDRIEKHIDNGMDSYYII